MYAKVLLPAMAGLAIANAQVTMAPPPPVLLTSTFSGVLPVIPTSTAFAGVDTNEGAIINPGPVVPGFTGPGGNATIQSNLPAATYVATMPNYMYDPYTGSQISGTVTAMTTANGTGVMFMVNLTGFPDVATYGPFLHHIHTLPVPADGNCTATLSHLDPTDRGELYMCDATQPQTCQAGDTAGKHGKIAATSFVGTFTDLYLSTVPGSPYFFGDKSFVIHSGNATRLICANFVQVTSANGNATAPSMPSPTFEAGASTFGISVAGAVVAVAALLFL